MGKICFSFDFGQKFHLVISARRKTYMRNARATALFSLSVFYLYTITNSKAQRWLMLLAKCCARPSATMLGNHALVSIASPRHQHLLCWRCCKWLSWQIHFPLRDVSFAWCETRKETRERNDSFNYLFLNKQSIVGRWTKVEQEPLVSLWASVCRGHVHAR